MRRMQLNSLQQLILGERFGEVVLRSNHTTTRFVKHPILGGQHHHGDVGKARVALDDRAGLISVEPRHEDVAEHKIGLIVVDLGQRVKAILCHKHLVPTLFQEDFGASTDRVAVIDHQDLERRRGWHGSLSDKV